MDGLVAGPHLDELLYPEAPCLIAFDRAESMDQGVAVGCGENVEHCLCLGDGSDRGEQVLGYPSRGGTVVGCGPAAVSLGRGHRGATGRGHPPFSLQLLDPGYVESRPAAARSA